MSTSTAVPAPDEPSSPSWPPSASTRSLRPTRPEPCPKSAPPRPSSRTLTRRTPLAAITVTVAAVAPACLAVLVSASETT